MTDLNQIPQRDPKHGHSILVSYIIGFVLCLVATSAAFYVASSGVDVVPRVLQKIVIILAFIQVIIQMVFFIRLRTNPDDRWSLIMVIFTVVIISILVAGSLWIMYDLNYYMVH